MKARPMPGAPGQRLRAAVGAVVAVLLFAVLGSSVAMADSEESAWLYDPNSVVEIDFDLPQSSVEALEEEPDEYQPGSFALKSGKYSYELSEVGVRLKGGLGSFRSLYEKAAFKVKFDEFVDDQTFFGLEKMTLNNMVQDASMVHETLTYKIFRSMGVPAPRTGYAFVRFNGEGFGVYLNIETYDLIALSPWFGSTRHLYEADQPGVDVSTDNAGAFEVDEGKSKKREDLEALIAAANSGAGDWSDGMASAADLAEMTRMWAVERYVGHWDGYAGVEGPVYRPNNYYLHSGDTGDEAGRFTMLPWGTDQTWGSYLSFDEPAGGLLFNRCYADPSCRALYVEGLQNLLDQIPSLELDSRATRIADILAPWQEMESEPRREHDEAEVEEALEGTRHYIEVRPDELASWLLPLPEPPSSDPPEPPKKRALWIGAPRVRGAVVETHLWIPRTGWVVQEVMVKLSGHWRDACSTRFVRYQAGLSTAHCRLAAAVRRRLDKEWLRLKVRVGFNPREGDSRFEAHRLTVPSR